MPEQPHPKEQVMVETGSSAVTTIFLQDHCNPNFLSRLWGTRYLQNLKILLLTIFVNSVEKSPLQWIALWFLP